MNKYQPLNFSTVEEFLDFLPDGERKVIHFLRQLILDNIPMVRERLAYNVPFYYQYSRICFLWPAAIPWGRVKASGVKLGFVNGHLIRDDLNYLEKGNRRQVRSKTFYTTGEIDPDLLKAFLFEAVEIDKMVWENNRTRQKR